MPLDQHDENSDEPILRDLIKRAKGYNRTMAEFAEVCGTNAILCSRIASGIKVRLTEDLLRRFHENQAVDANISWEDWVKASQTQGIQQRAQWPDVITAFLAKRGIALQIENSIEFGNDYIDTQLRTECDLIINLIKLKKRWSFFAPRYGFTRMSFDRTKGSKITAMRSCHCEKIFLQDAWFPKTMSKEKTSFVFTRRELMKLFIEEFGEGKFKNDFSIIFVKPGLSNNVTIEEYMMNGEEYPDSIFSQE